MVFLSYVMPQPEEEFHLETSSDEESDNSLSSTYGVMSSSDEANEPAIVTWFTYVFS